MLGGLEFDTSHNSQVLRIVSAAHGSTGPEQWSVVRTGMRWVMSATAPNVGGPNGCIPHSYLYKSNPAASLEPRVGVYAFSDNLANFKTLPSPSVNKRAALVTGSSTFSMTTVGPGILTYIVQKNAMCCRTRDWALTLFLAVKRQVLSQPITVFFLVSTKQTNTNYRCCTVL